MSAVGAVPAVAAAAVAPGVVAPAAEMCNGDLARRSGNEFLFQMMAEMNIATLQEAGVKKIVTACPHCFHTLGKEYGDYGGDFEVVHHTQLLAGSVPMGADRFRIEVVDAETGRAVPMVEVRSENQTWLTDSKLSIPWPIRSSPAGIYRYSRAAWPPRAQ